MFCTNCGKNIPDNTAVCPFCDQKIMVPQNILDNSENTNCVHAKKDYSVPLSTTAFFFMQVIFLIPILNLICLLIWSFKKNINANQRSFSQSVLIWYIFIGVAILATLLTFMILKYPISLNHWFLAFKNFINSIPEL